MAGICFHFETNDADVYSGRLMDIDAWIYAMKLPGDIDRAHVVNTSGLPLSGLDMNFEWSFSDEIPNLAGSVAYFVAPGQEGSSLWDFDHKTDWYVFGPARGMSPGPTQRRITIPQSNPNVHLHSVHIATTVMFHRYEVVK